MYQEIMRLRDVTKALNGQLNSTMLAADERANDIRNLTTRLGEVTMGMKAAMQSGQKGLSDSADRIETLGEGTRKALITQGEKLATISEQIALRSHSIATSFERQQRAITENATTGAAAIEGVVERMQSGAQAITISAESSARDLDWLCSHIQAAGEAVDFMGAKAQAAMNRAREALVVSEASLQRSASSARVNLSELAERYNAESVRVNGISDDLSLSYDSAIKRLESLGHQLAGQSFVTFDTLTELGNLFDARIAQLREGGDLVSGQLTIVTDAMQHNYNALTATTQTAVQQLAQIQEGLQKTYNDTDISTEHARTRVEAVRRELSAYAQDLMMMVSQASGQIDAAAAGFGAKAEAVRAAANENVGQLGDLGARVRSEIDLLVRTVKEAIQPNSGALATSIERLRQQSESLMRQTQQSFQEMERYSARAVQSAQAVGQNADRAAQQVQTAAAQFVRQSEQVATASQTAAQRVAVASQTVQMQTQSLKEVSERAAGLMAGSGQQVQQIIASLSAQLTQVERVNSQANDTAQRLTQSENHAKRDAFLNTAKFIIEGLNSLAIDLTRVLDAQEAERAWQEFNKGDVGAFTRRFVQMRDDVPTQRLREKFLHDNDFRTYATRYFRQFEELFEQAIANDHNDLLATTLTTSDVGKLYTYLAGALGHSKLKTARAA
jgi:ABC-type transporter Mla subunit MlaD